MIEQFHTDELLTLYRGNCLELTMPEPAQHIVTDLPYTEETHRGARTDPNYDGQKWASGGNEGQRLIDFDSITFDQAVEYLRFLTPLFQRWLIAFMDWRHVAPLEALLNSSEGAGRLPGLRFVRFGIWSKTNGAPQMSGDRPSQGWEAIAILHRTGGRMRWNGGGKRAVWTGPKVNSFHKTQKPDWLIDELLWDFTQPGDHILDPFAGSFAIAARCKVLGRRCTAVELDNTDKGYCEHARQHVQALRPMPALFRGRQARLFEEVA